MSIYYLKMSQEGSGFTNQIFAFITGIINEYKNNCRIVIIDNFLNDINKLNYTTISDIFDMTKLNIFLKKYNIICFDKNSVHFTLNSIKYGHDNYIELTDNYRIQNSLFIDKNTIFNNIKGDPCPGIPKKLIVTYQINEYIFEEIYNENLKYDIIINFDSPYIFTFGWINSFNNNMFDDILIHIPYHSQFIENSLPTNTNKKNVIHLRLEQDGLDYWSRVNKMSVDNFKAYLEQKYIDIITNYIDKSHETIIVSNSLSNPVIDFLQHQNYNYKIIDKLYKDREKDAIIDLLVSTQCNNIFIGNFNIKNSNGSTFSYYIGKLLNTKKIYIDLDKIYDKEVCI